MGNLYPGSGHATFLDMAHYHGQTFNGSELGRSLGLSSKTIRSYLDILTGTFNKKAGTNPIVFCTFYANCT